jgi:actin-like protein 6A
VLRATQIWSHALSRRLRITSMEHPLLVAEPTANSKAAREKMVELIFERYAPPALFLAKNSVLSSFAVGRATSLVIDCGAAATVVSAVHDGYALSKAVHRSPLGGAALTDLLLRTLVANGEEVKPRFTFKRAARDGGGFTVTPVATTGVTPSFTLHKRWEVAADIKESCCRLLDVAFREEDAAAAPSAPYELPDGRAIEVGAERFKIPELLFNPSLLASFPAPMDAGSPGAPGSLIAELAAHAGSMKGLSAAMLEVVNRCDVDIRREMFGGVVLTGGGSLFPNLKERAERELAEAAPATVKLKLLASASTPERKYSVWLGGSILASLGSFQQLWMSKAEYEEHGAAFVHKKCP